MKYLLMILAVVMIFAAPALALDGNVSNANLAKMGLSGMNVMSDTEGTAVRGMGFAFSGSAAVVVVSGNTVVLVAPSVQIKTGNSSRTTSYSIVDISGMIGNLVSGRIYISAGGSASSGRR